MLPHPHGTVHGGGGRAADGAADALGGELDEVVRLPADDLLGVGLQDVRQVHRHHYLRACGMGGWG